MWISEELGLNDPYHHRDERRTNLEYLFLDRSRRLVISAAPLNYADEIWVDINVLDGTEIYAEGHFIVYLNGNVLGLTRCAPRFVSQFRLLRRAGKLSEFVSIYVNHGQQCVHIASDEGRICRPMIIVEDGKSRVRDYHMKVRF